MLVALLVLAILLMILFGALGVFLNSPLFWIIVLVVLFLALGGGYYGRGAHWW